MIFLKTFRKKIKSSFVFNVLQNLFFTPLKSYSDAFGEDLFVNHYFSNISKGIYVDVGCNQPKINSLTFKLHKKGWKGLNFDILEKMTKIITYQWVIKINW